MPDQSVHDGSCMYGHLGNRFGKDKESWMVRTQKGRSLLFKQIAKKFVSYHVLDATIPSLHRLLPLTTCTETILEAAAVVRACWGLASGEGSGPYSEKKSHLPFAPSSA